MDIYNPAHQPLPPEQDHPGRSFPQWSVGRQTVVRADCLDYLRARADRSVDVVVTSPPYNIGVRYEAYRDKLPRDQYLAWLSDIGVELCRVLKDDGSFFLNVGNTNKDPWIEADVANAFRRSFALQNHITWIKSISIGEDTVGHFKPITSKRYLNNNHEAIFHFTKQGNTHLDRIAIGVPFKDKSNIERWGHKRDKRCAGNVWFIPYKTVTSKAEKFDHPAGFPVDLAARCIKLHARPEAIVLDPFLGAGSTLVAAEQLGCTGIGVEIGKQYAATSVARLQSMFAPHAEAAPHGSRSHPGPA